MGLEINVLKKESDGLVIISLRGSLDTENHQSFRDRADKELMKKPKGLVLDLEFLEYISSMGISAILGLNRNAVANGTKFMMSNIPESIDQIFKIVKALPPNIQMFESMEEADQYFLGIQKKIKDQGQ